jgi:predicted lipid-binding transport protein (Tim44 family)
MALSEHEQKMLDELERGLYQSDANFVNRVSSASGKSPASRLVGGALLALIGISLLVFAVIIQLVVFGVIGFLFMLLGLVLASSNWSSSALTADSKPQKKKTNIQSPRNFFEDRWDRRQGS